MKTIAPFTITPVKEHATPTYPEGHIEKTTGRRILKTATKLIFTGSLVLMGTSCFGTTDGDMVTCTPGDLYCASADQVSLCTDENGYEEYLYLTCDEYCERTMGPGSTATTECTAETPEDPCGCTE